jgi:hypothetical protein
VALAGALGDLGVSGAMERGGVARWAPTVEAAALSQAAADLPVMRKKKRRGGTASGPAPGVPPPPPTQPSSPASTSATLPVPLPPEPAPPVGGRLCAPRPPILLRAEPALLPEPGLGLPGRDALLVTVSTSGVGRGIRKIDFQVLSNAVVTIADGPPHATPFSTTYRPGLQPAALQFTVWRPDPSQGSWLRLSIVDGCGEWSTFTGRGPGA